MFCGLLLCGCFGSMQAMMYWCCSVLSEREILFSSYFFLTINNYFLTLLLIFLQNFKCDVKDLLHFL